MDEEAKDVSIQFFLKPAVYGALLSLKGTRTWSQFIEEDLLLRKPVTEAIQQMKNIQEQEKNPDASQVDIRTQACEICGVYFPVTELTELSASKKLLCKDCYEAFFKDEEPVM